jgi:dTMP kinase
LCRDLQPDLTILMLSDPAASLSRARRRNVQQSRRSKADENRFEQENRAFYNRVLDAYAAIADSDPQRIVKVDAREPVTKVHKRIVGIVQERLGVGHKS